MKVGIISINRYSKHLNYGAALHSYAFQHYLDLHGIDNVIIDYFPKFMEHYSLKYPFLSKQPKEQLKRSLFWFFNFFPNIRKYKKFENFFKNHYRMTKCQYTEPVLRNAQLDFDTVICESDVIWSPHSTGGFDNGYFCNMPSMQGKNKISYAACIGYTNFSEKRQERFRALLKNFDAISVREIQGTEFTQQFTEQKVYNVLDPTLLLDAKDYQDIIIPPKESNYVLVYNCLKNNRKMLRDAKKVAQQKNMKVIELSVYYNNFYLNKVKLSIGIEEFLGYFQNASYVFTNAFHGVCFSLIFKKNFYTYARGTKDSRVTSILHLLELDSKFLENDEELPPIEDIDYQKVYRNLERERKNSEEFLFNAVNQKKA